MTIQMFFYVLIEIALILLLLKWLANTDKGQTFIKGLLEQAEKGKKNYKHPFPNMPKEAYEGTLIYFSYELNMACRTCWIELLKSFLKEENL